MTKLIQIATAMLLVICTQLQTPMGQAGAANQQVLKEIYLESQDHTYQIETNANAISWKLLAQTDEQVAAGTLTLDNPYGRRQTATVKLNFPRPGKYNLDFHLSDDVKNQSNVFRQPFSYSKPPEDGGNVYGADADNPWGINNSYSKRRATATLVIDRTTTEEKYHFEAPDIPAPVLTYTHTKDGQATVYGSSLSKKSLLQIKVKKLLPSYYKASDTCRAGNPLRKLFKPLTAKSQECMRKLLEIDDLDHYLNQLQAQCKRSYNPLFVHACIDKQLGTDQTRYYATVAVPIEHVRLDVFRNFTKHLATRWQESEHNFSHQWRNVKPGDYIHVRASIFGEVRLGAKAYDYRASNFQSNISNMLKLKPENLRAGKQAATTTCHNKACKLLNVKYFNQAVNAKGKWERWAGWPHLAGGQSCGAASSVMVNSYFGKLPTTKHSLKSYVFRDNGQKLKHKRCNRQGAFAATAYNSECNQSSLKGIENYLGQYGLSTRVLWPKRSEQSHYITQIKQAIDAGQPVILSYRKPIGHILVVKGYTFDNQLIVNDPYRDIQTNYIKGKYDYSGNGAVYSLYPNQNFVVNYLLIVSR